MTTLAESTAVLTEFAVRDYLRTVPGLLERVSGDTRKIDLDYSGKGTFLTLYRAGGFPHRSLPMDRALITFHCWGTTRHAAALLEVQLVKALRSLSSTQLNADVFCFAAEVTSSGAYLPSSEGQHRYVASAAIDTRQAAA